VRSVRLLVATSLAAALLVGCGATAKTTKIEVPAAPTSAFAGAEVTPPRVAQPIALHDAWGRPVTLASLRGRYVLVTFLYVHCPDVCPLIAQNLNAALEQLGPKRSKVRVLAVSVDPKGDTPAAVKRYIAQRGLVPQFRYLVGTRAQLGKVWAAWHVLAVLTKPGADVVDHVAYTALVDPTGKERVLYDSKVKAHQVLHDLHVLMSAS
jgi:protein SCO1/2